MRLSLAAAVASLVLLLLPVGTPTADAKTTSAAIKCCSGHKHHYKLYVRKHGKHYHCVHTFKSHKEAHKVAHKYHKKGYRTKIRTV